MERQRTREKLWIQCSTGHLALDALSCKKLMGDVGLDRERRMAKMFYVTSVAELESSKADA